MINIFDLDIFSLFHKNWFWFSNFFFILGYAEIHYRFRFLPSFLFKKEPEIVFDLPIRAQLGKPVPLFLFIKDANLYPVILLRIEIRIQNNQDTFSIEHDFSLLVKEKFFAKTIWLPSDIFKKDGPHEITVHLKYQTDSGKIKHLIQDNYRTIPHRPFHIYLSKYSLPKVSNWLWGDLHIHSNYTDDQVEFGASIAETIEAARTIGLDFLAITDHSFDLDDHPDDYLKNDHTFPKWRKFQSEVANLQQQFSDFAIIPGEEVSVGNSRKQNVHCLIFNDKKFHPGNGDSAEKLFYNQPTMSLKTLLEKKNSSALAIAAHPTESPPFSQRLILRKGKWTEIDLRLDKLDALQILNGNDEHIQKGKDAWIKLLLEGRRIPIIAGNDAHGNFNCFRQIRIPFWKMTYSRKHLLGSMRTAVRVSQNSRKDILNAIRKSRVIVSNGPFAIFYLHGKVQAQIGDTFKGTGSVKIFIKAVSTIEYGCWEEIKLFIGNILKGKEKEISISFPKNELQLEIKQKLNEINWDYIRLEAYTRKESNRYFCFTNPIWIEGYTA